MDHLVQPSTDHEEDGQDGHLMPLAHEGPIATSPLSRSDSKSTCVASERALQTDHGQDPRLVTAPLQRSSWIFWLVILFAALASVSWGMACRLAFRPPDKDHAAVWEPSRTLQSISPASRERWTGAIQVFQAILILVAVPITIAVWSRMAAIYSQRTRSLTLRQTLAMSDHSWLDLRTWPHLFGLRARESATVPRSFSLLGLALTATGFAVPILIAIFTSTAWVKVPSPPSPPYDESGSTWAELFAVQSMSLWAVEAQQGAGLSQLELTTMDISRLSSTLWFSEAANITSPTDVPDNSDIQARQPYVAQLPPLFSTGVLQQLSYRINSSVEVSDMTSTEFTTSCRPQLGDYSLNYTFIDTSGLGGEDGIYNWTLVACLPSNATKSPWIVTTDRQDFSEVLYLNFTVLELSQSPFHYQTYYKKIVATTTGGFFELPNYANDGVAGPLLDHIVDANCDECMIQLQALESYPIGNNQAQPPETWAGEPTLDFLNSVENAGPLFMMTLALFGNNTLVQDNLGLPANTSIAAGGLICQPVLPFGRLAYGPDYSDLDVCYGGPSHGPYLRTLSGQVTALLNLLALDTTDTGNLLTAGLQVVNQVFMDTFPVGYLEVHYDPGILARVPVISLAGLIVISIVLGVYLLALLALSWYCSRARRWTEQLDALAILRMGVAAATDNSSTAIPFNMVTKFAELDMLDATPGWVGSSDLPASPMDEDANGQTRNPTTRRQNQVHQLALGGPNLLPRTQASSNLTYYHAYKMRPHPTRFDEVVSVQGGSYVMGPLFRGQGANQHEA